MRDVFRRFIAAFLSLTLAAAPLQTIAFAEELSSPEDEGQVALTGQIDDESDASVAITCNELVASEEVENESQVATTTDSSDEIAELDAADLESESASEAMSNDGPLAVDDCESGDNDATLSPDIESSSITADDGWDDWDNHEDSEDEYYEEDYSLEDATITFYGDYDRGYEYTGEPIEPEFDLWVNNELLYAYHDYTYDVERKTNAGTGYIYIYGMRDYEYEQIVRTFRIKPKTIVDCSIGDLFDEEYTGFPIEPDITVYDANRAKYLRRDRDYTLSFKNNVKVGTASIVIKGKGNYTGTINRTFRISKGWLLTAEVGDIAVQKWTGKAVKPTPAVYFHGKKLKAGIDFSLRYKNNVKPGSRATVTIVGKGSLYGSVSANFYVGPKPGKWLRSGSRWWYRFSDGTYPASKFVYIGGKWYYFDASGWMVTGWRKVGIDWYYFRSNGSMVTGWQRIGGKWYYFHKDGDMGRGELIDDYYYLDSNGTMATGWRCLHGDDWWYFNPDGSMATGCWVGDYYVGPDGIMLRNTTTPDGYWVGSNGKWVRYTGGTGDYDVDYSETVYWVSGGTVWHKSENCPSLSRSSNIHSGTVEESGKSRGCSNCT